MRCNNCGWENPNGSQRCEKCNTSLQDYVRNLNGHLIEITIGRKSDNDVVLNDPCVGRFVAKVIRHDDGHYSIVDLMSTNGIYVNGKLIPAGVEVNINNNDVILIGRTTLNLEEIIIRARLRGISIEDPTCPPSENAMCYCQMPPDWENNREDKDTDNSKWQKILSTTTIVIISSIIFGTIIALLFV